MTDSTADQALAVDTLRTLVHGELTELEQLYPHLGRLVNTRQRGIGFLDAAAKAAQDQMLRADRAARYPGRYPRPVGLKFLVPLTLVTASGDRPAPGNITAQSMRSLLHRRLADWTRFLTLLLREQGVCLIHGMPPEPDFFDLTWRLTALVRVLSNVDDLTDIGEDLAHLVEQAKRIVDGDDKKTLPDPCPHCGRQSLVVYLTKGIIRCEEDVHGHYAPCRCADAYCRCRFHDHRHEWYRDTTKLDATKRSWWHLRDALTLAERARTNETGANA